MNRVAIDDILPFLALFRKTPFSEKVFDKSVKLDKEKTISAESAARCANGSRVGLIGGVALARAIRPNIITVRVIQAGTRLKPAADAPVANINGAGRVALVATIFPFMKTGMLTNRNSC